MANGNDRVAPHFLTYPADARNAPFGPWQPPFFWIEHSASLPQRLMWFARQMDSHRTVWELQRALLSRGSPRLREPRALKLPDWTARIHELLERSREANRIGRVRVAAALPALPKPICGLIAAFLFEVGCFGRLESVVVFPVPARPPTIDPRASLDNTQPTALHLNAYSPLVHEERMDWHFALDECVRLVGVRIDGSILVLTTSSTIALFSADCRLISTGTLQPVPSRGLFPSPGGGQCDGAALPRVHLALLQVLPWNDGGDPSWAFSLRTSSSSSWTAYTSGRSALLRGRRARPTPPVSPLRSH